MQNFKNKKPGGSRAGSYFQNISDLIDVRYGLVIDPDLVQTRFFKEFDVPLFIFW